MGFWWLEFYLLVTFLETSWDAVLEEGPLLDTDLEVSVPLGTFYLLDTYLNCIPV